MTPEPRYAVPHTRRTAPANRQVRAARVTPRVAADRLIQPLRASSVEVASQRVLPLRKSQGGRKPSTWSRTRMKTRKRKARAAAFINYRSCDQAPAANYNVTVVVA